MRIKPNRLFGLSLLLLAALFELTLFGRKAQAEVLVAPYIELEVVSDFLAAKPEAPLSLGVRMKTEEGWHVYWKYAGDSGSAPKFHWKINDQPASASLLWATPQRFPVGPLMNYGYEGESLVIANFPAPVPASGETLKISLDAEWLVCREECIPGNGEVSFSLPVDRGPQQPSPWAELFQATRQRVPIFSSEIPVSAHFENGVYTITFTPPTHEREGLEVHYIPDVGDVIENAAPQKLLFDGKEHHLEVPKNIVEETVASRLSGILVSNKGWAADGGAPALEIDVVVNGAPMAASEKTKAAVTQPSSQSSSQSSSEPLVPLTEEEPLTLWTALIGAFLGGLILNVMPCVFPVLSIKILSFATEAGHSPRAARNHGFLFGLGVLGSFWLLAGILFVLRAAGEGLGWGFQLQSPGFVLALLFVVFAIALNLLSVFEVGSTLQRAVGTIQTGEGALGAIGSGALAVVLATPCTAPFMGSALAFALTVSTLEGLAVFTALGIGMALPYVTLCSIPRLIKILPRPGTWMVTFKHLMAFPLFATVIWLLWVLGLQAGQDAIIAALVGLLAAGLGLWGLGNWSSPARTRKTRIFGRVFALAFITLGAWVAWQSVASGSQANAPTEGAPSKDRYGLEWLPYSDQALEELLASGRPIYIDFTAAWCITCQVNKRVVLSSSEVQQEFRAHNVALLRGDWTTKDERITAALARFGRQGVPLNLLYSGKAGESPHVFPSILTSSIVLAELRRLR